MRDRNIFEGMVIDTMHLPDSKKSYNNIGQNNQNINNTDYLDDNDSVKSFINNCNLLGNTFSNSTTINMNTPLQKDTLPTPLPQTLLSPVTQKSNEAKKEKGATSSTTKSTKKMAIKNLARKREKTNAAHGSVNDKPKRTRQKREKLQTCPREGCTLKYSTDSSIRNHIRLKHKPLDNMKPAQTLNRRWMSTSMLQSGKEDSRNKSVKKAVSEAPAPAAGGTTYVPTFKQNGVLNNDIPKQLGMTPQEIASKRRSSLDPNNIRVRKNSLLQQVSTLRPSEETGIFRKSSHSHNPSFDDLMSTTKKNLPKSRSQNCVLMTPNKAEDFNYFTQQQSIGNNQKGVSLTVPPAGDVNFCTQDFGNFQNGVLMTPNKPSIIDHFAKNIGNAQNGVLDTTPIPNDTPNFPLLNCDDNYGNNYLCQVQDIGRVLASTPIYNSGLSPTTNIQEPTSVSPTVMDKIKNLNLHPGMGGLYGTASGMSNTVTNDSFTCSTSSVVMNPFVNDTIDDTNNGTSDDSNTFQSLNVNNNKVFDVDHVPDENSIDCLYNEQQQGQFLRLDHGFQNSNDSLKIHSNFPNESKRNLNFNQEFQSSDNNSVITSIRSCNALPNFELGVRRAASVPSVKLSENLIAQSFAASDLNVSHTATPVPLLSPCYVNITNNVKNHTPIHRKHSQPSLQQCMFKGNGAIANQIYKEKNADTNSIGRYATNIEENSNTSDELSMAIGELKTSLCSTPILDIYSNSMCSTPISHSCGQEISVSADSPCLDAFQNNNGLALPNQNLNDLCQNVTTNLINSNSNDNLNMMSNGLLASNIFFS